MYKYVYNIVLFIFSQPNELCNEKTVVITA
jgi:hypothetical protein